MGRPKALLPWKGLPLVHYQVSSLAEAGLSPIVVVLGHKAHEVAPFVRGSPAVRVVINHHYAQGKATSVRLGMREVGKGTEGVLLLAVDQPRPPALLQHLLQEHLARGALITLPTYGRRRGHPVLFHRSLLPELVAVTEEGQGVRAVVEGHRADVLEVPVDDPVALLDINTEEQYREALARFGADP